MHHHLSLASNPAAITKKPMNCNLISFGIAFQQLKITQLFFSGVSCVLSYVLQLIVRILLYFMIIVEIYKFII